jgi:hypothetical protein
LLKIFTLPNHTITIDICILETRLLGLLYGGGASFVQKWSMPWMSARFCYVIFNSLMFNAPMFNSEKDVSLTFFLL